MELFICSVKSVSKNLAPARCVNTWDLADFFNDPDPMPQFIVVARTTQQGNATFVEQKQIPNPNRVKKFCIEGECKCLLNDLEHPICCRYSGCSTCTNYCEVEQFNFVQDFPVRAVDEN